MKNESEDARLEEGLELLRHLPPTSPEAVEAVMTRIREASREAGSGGPRHRWVWAGVGGLVAAAAALVLLAPRPDAPGGPLEADGDARRVQFVYVAEGARDVSLLGTFNDWDPVANPLGRVGRTGPWVTEIALPPGRYEYAYRVDGELRTDASALRAGVDEYGSVNSVIVVEAAERGELE